MTTFQTKTILMLGLAAAAISPSARADEWNQKTTFTFSGPVEIPGRTLEAGTYVFKLANSITDHRIIQVFSGDETRIYATFLAIPDYRMTPSDKTIITFRERPAGSPEAIKGWFYPGRQYGHEFVYPKAKAVQLAKERHTPVPAMPTELAVDTIKPAITLNSAEVAELQAAPLVAEEPDGTEVEVETVFTATATAPHPEQPAELPEELPETATMLPLIGLAGALSLGIAATLRATAARRK